MMGDLNQLDFIKKNIKKFKEPYLEIGTRYSLTWEIRKLFSNSEYIGVDMEDGPEVDVVLDLTKDFNIVDKILNQKRFNTVFCLSVLEHYSNPFMMAENITKLLNRNGVLYVPVPFSWKFHAFPSDYWRFTPEGIRILFPKIVFNFENSNMATSDIGDIRKIDNDLCRIRFSISTPLNQRKYGMADGCHHKTDKEVRNRFRDFQISICNASSNDKYDWHKKVGSLNSFKRIFLFGNYGFYVS